VLWIKAFHIIFMVTWFAGLFYLPRLFVYHALASQGGTLDTEGNERFMVMERKLYVIMSIGAAGTIAFGLWMLFAYAWQTYAGMYWLQVKLALSVVLIAYHLYCGHLVRVFAGGRNRHGHVYYRWLNEIPSLLLIGIVILAVVKPF